MIFNPKEPPREFSVGRNDQISILDCGIIELEPNEQVSFVTEKGNEYDVVKKDWGFYATPSLDGRLHQQGFQPHLVRSIDTGRHYLLLVEDGYRDDALEYFETEGLESVAIFDIESSFNLDSIPSTGIKSDVRCICEATDLQLEHVYHTPPTGEKGFEFIDPKDYERKLFKCSYCGHYRSVHHLDDEDLYESDYVDSTYGGLDGIREAYERVVSLPPEESDNVGRVKRVDSYARDRYDVASEETLHALDVDSGLCVFLDELQKHDWIGTALDVDDRFVRHARNEVGVEAFQGDFRDITELGPFDLVTFNKVLEHVDEPATMLSVAKRHLREGGIVYVEVPDGEAAIYEGPEREEFFIDHKHVFSVTSLSRLAVSVGFYPERIERIRDPSGKFTLIGFLSESGGTRLTPHS